MKQGERPSEAVKLEKAKAIADLLAQGYAMESACSQQGISGRTLLTWRNKNSEISRLIENAFQEWDQQFRIALVKRAETNIEKLADGYKYKETKTIMEATDDSGKEGKVKRREVTEKEVAPSLGANIFILTNFAPDKYKNKVAADITGKVKVDNSVTFPEMTFEELYQLRYGKKPENDKFED